VLGRGRVLAAAPVPLIPRAQRQVFVYLLAALLVETLFFVVLSPLLPVYARELHLSRSAAGLLSACYSIGYGLAALPAGAAVGVLGPRRVSLGGLALVAVGCAAFGAARVPLLLDLARALTGAGAAGVWAGSIPWMESLAGGQERGRLIGVAFSAASAGSCAGPAVGALATVTGPRPVFLALSVVIGLLVVWGAVVSAGREPPMPARAGGGAREALGTMRDGLRAPQAGVALAMVALPTVGLGVCGVLMPLRLRGLGVAELAIAIAYLTAAVLEVLANPLIGRWFDRRGGALVLRWALLLCGACVTVLALPLPAAALLATLVLAYLVLNACWVPALAQLSTTLERGGAAPGVALGLFNVSWAIFQVVGSIGGAEVSRVGIAAPFLVLTALFAVGACATSRLATPPPGDGAEPERGSR
jgi:MFS transporter, DHA1 family, solute carrier family 18 (vesicular amine transporter), member 1/2